MSKKILKLEKETNMWKQRWEKSHHALLEMATDKQTRDAEIATLNRKCSLLQELCKAFQKERTTLLDQLKDKTTKLDLEIDQQLKTEDNKELIKSIEYNVEDPLQEDPLKNGPALLENIDIKAEEQTAEPKTEVDPIPEVNDSEAVSRTESNSEDVQDISITPVNSVDILPAKPDETQLTTNIYELNKEENSSVCDKVPVETQAITETKTVLNPEQLLKIEDIKLEPEDEKKEVLKVEESNVILKTTDQIKCEVSDKLENHTQDSLVPEIKDEPKVHNHIEDTNKTIPNGEIHANAATNKKHKVNSFILIIRLVALKLICL